MPAPIKPRSWKSCIIMCFSPGRAVKNWAVEATIEYASPRDDAQAKAFLDAVYTARSPIAAK